jgi:hypothetical protein
MSFVPDFLMAELDKNRIGVVFPDRTGHVYLVSKEGFNMFEYDNWIRALEAIVELQIKPIATMKYDPKLNVAAWKILPGAGSLTTSEEGKLMKKLQNITRIPLDGESEVTRKQILSDLRFFFQFEQLSGLVNSHIRKGAVIGEVAAYKMPELKLPQTAQMQLTEAIDATITEPTKTTSRKKATATAVK